MPKEITFNKSVTELVRQRYSCRTHLPFSLEQEHLSALSAFIDKHSIGPFGNAVRFVITASSEEDSTALRNLGTYGFIKDPAGFIIGISKDAPNALEDFGYTMETIILRATELGIGTCWLGGTFTKSRFSRLANLKDGEAIPAVVSFGYPADEKAWLERATRIYAGSDRRLPWHQIFFDRSLSQPLEEIDAGDYRTPLEMVRLAPSASNKQPWRVIKAGKDWHFYLQRTKHYPAPIYKSLAGLADLQRIDLGIAMAHFDLAAREMGLMGSWQPDQPGIAAASPDLEYAATWREAA